MKNVWRWLWLPILAGILVFGCAEQNDTPRDSEWISLFNGENMDGWTPKFSGYELGVNHLNTFRVEDGKLVISYENWQGWDGTFGHLFYQTPYSSYRLRAEYRFVGEQVDGGPGWAFRNSGLMLHCQDPKILTLDQSFPVCIEVQLLGGNGEDERSTANLCTPGTNVVMGGQLVTEHCLNSTSPTFHGDQWVTVEVEVHSDSLFRHYVNGDLVFEYEKPQYDPNDESAQPLIEDESNLLIGSGYISVQAESHPHEFRKIEILPLDE